MNKLNFFLVVFICGFISACTGKNINLGSVNIENKKAYVKVSADIEDIIITKINGLPTNAVPPLHGLKNAPQYLIKPGNTVIEAYFIVDKEFKVSKCFNLKAGKSYIIRTKELIVSSNLVASITTGILISGIDAPKCL